MDGGENIAPLVRFEVPGPPRGWQRTGQRVVSPKGGGKPFVVNYTPGQTRIEEGAVREIAAGVMAGRAPLDCPIDLRVMAFYPVPRSWSKVKQARALVGVGLPTVKPDFDNVSAIVDAIKGIVWRDDALVCNFHFWKRYGDRPRIVIEVRQAGAGNAA